MKVLLFCGGLATMDTLRDRQVLEEMVEGRRMLCNWRGALASGVAAE